jgi:hypothetical protein
VRIEQLVAAETGWKAVFTEPNGSTSQSRILGWGVLRKGTGAAATDDVVGMIVDPTEPSRIVAATEAASPGGGTFARYRFEPPKPPAPPPPPPAPPAREPDAADHAQELAKGFLRRRR